VLEDLCVCTCAHAHQFARVYIRQVSFRTQMLRYWFIYRPRTTPVVIHAVCVFVCMCVCVYVCMCVYM